MPSGGHVNSGPPPDPGALRRDRKDDQAGWTTLPAAGRSGALPEWPLLGLADRELDLWRDMWARPQAVMWERLGQQIEVAMFVRKLGEAELPKASVELQKVVRQYLDSLGLSVQGMLRNRWRIATVTGGQVGDAPAAPARQSARSRMRVVQPDERGV